jgi:transposase-like protein
MKNLSSQHKKVLLENPNVLKITEKHITYTPAFKIRAVELSLKGIHADDIFSEHGIDPSLFPEGYCRYCLKRWRNKYNSKGKNSLKKDERGSSSSGRPRQDLDSLSMNDLKALVLIQEEFIKQIKKKKALAKKS